MNNRTTLKKVLIYIVPPLVTVILSIITLVLVSNYSMKYINITVETIQFVCGIISLIGILVCMQERRDSPLLKIIAQGLFCFILGELYWVLHIYIKGYEQAGSFSISDLSWIGFYIFLLSICRDFFQITVDFKKNKYRIINIFSCIAPIFIIGTGIALYLSGDNLFYTIIYCIPTGFLSYFTLRNIFLSSNDHKMLRAFREYNIVVGMILIIDNLACLALNYGFTDAEYVFKFCFALLLLAITPAVYKGVLRWHQ